MLDRADRTTPGFRVTPLILSGTQPTFISFFLKEIRLSPHKRRLHGEIVATGGLLTERTMTNKARNLLQELSTRSDLKG